MVNIVGYCVVIEVVNNFGCFFMGQVMVVGKVLLVKVLIVGVGVVGFVVIGVVISLGVQVYVFDVWLEVVEQIELMGVEFVYLDFFEVQIDGVIMGGYVVLFLFEFCEVQLKKFCEFVFQMDIVIIMVLIFGCLVLKLWIEDMVQVMKIGSVIVDFVVECGGNCDLIILDECFVIENGVVIIGYIDFFLWMGVQVFEFYGNNICYMLVDLIFVKDGVIVQNMEDDVICGVIVIYDGDVIWLLLLFKVVVIVVQKFKEKVCELMFEEKWVNEVVVFKVQIKLQVMLFVVGVLVMLLVGWVVLFSFFVYFIVFVLVCFVGFQVIWNVSYLLYMLLMVIINVIFLIIIVGVLLQIGLGLWLVVVLGVLLVLMVGVNIFGGFLVMCWMLVMFQKL